MTAAAKAAGVEIRTTAEVARDQRERRRGDRGRSEAAATRFPRTQSSPTPIPSARCSAWLIRSTSTPSFPQQLQHYRMNGTVAKVNLALSGLPNFTGVRTASSSALHGPHPDRPRSTTWSAPSTPPSTASSRSSRISKRRFPRCAIRRSRPQASTSCRSTCSTRPTSCATATGTRSATRSAM